MKGILHLPRQRYHRRRLGYVSPVRLRGFPLSGKLKSTLAATLAFIFTFSPVLPSLDPLVLFGALSSEASTLTWDGGGADNFWSTPENWSEDRLPTPDDIVSFTDLNTKDVYIDIDISVAGIDIRSTYSSLIEARSGKRITIGSEGFAQDNGRFIASTAPMDVLGSLQLQGGTFTAPSNTLSVKGNFQVAGGSFEHNNSTVMLTGVEQIVFGSTTFFNLQKISQVASTLELQSGSTITIEGKLALKGAEVFAGEGRLTVRASKVDQPAILDPRGPIDLSYLALQDLINQSPTPVVCDPNCVNTGNVNGIDIPAAPSPTPTVSPANLLDRLKGLLPGDLLAPSSDQSAPSAPTGQPLNVSNHTEITEIGANKVTTDFAADEPVVFVIEQPQSSNATLQPVEAATNTTPLPTVSGSTPTPTATPEPTPTPTPEVPAFERLNHLLFGADVHAQESPPNSFQAQVIDPYGEIAKNITPIIATIDGKTIIHVSKPQESAFNPGRYTLKLSYEDVTFTQDFTWGVLAMNFPKSSYTANESASVGLAVLDDGGHTLCNADVTLTISASDSDQPLATFSTDDGTVTRSATCGPTTVTNEPDYQAVFPAPDPGTYVIQATATTQSGTRTLTRPLEVTTSDPTFVTERLAPTRIYPVENYTQNITITAKEDFTGTITETVPASFVISNQPVSLTGVGGPEDEVLPPTPEELPPTPTPAVEPSPTPDPTPTPTIEPTASPAATPSPTPDPTAAATPPPSLEQEQNDVPSSTPPSATNPPTPLPSFQVTPTDKGTQTITWPNVSLKAGQSLTLSYTFDAPNVSPEFYLLGPLKINNWQEPHQWQIASDAIITWDGGGSTNNWNEDANWSTDTEPGTSDIATFDGTSTKDVTIDKNISVAGIDINTGYTGTITQGSGFTVTVGTSNYDQAAGTFTGGNSTIDINGTYTLSGGTFTATSGTMSIGLSTGNNTTIFTIGSSGTFTHNSGTVQFDPNDSAAGTTFFTVDVNSTLTLNHIIFAAPGSPDDTYLTTASGDTITALGNFTHTAGRILGTWEVQGNFTVGTNAFESASEAIDPGIITMTGSASATYTYSGSGSTSHLRINKTGGAGITPAGSTTNLSVDAFSLLAGSFTAPSGNMTIGMPNDTDRTIFSLASGTTFSHNSGTIIFDPQDQGIGETTFTIDVDGSHTFNNVTYNAVNTGTDTILTTGSGDTIIVSGNFIQTDGSLSGTWEVQGNVTIGTAASLNVWGIPATLAFTGTNNQTYTDQGGNEPDGDITINKTSGTVTLASNADWNATDQDVTITDGTLYQAGFTLATNVLTVTDTLQLQGSETVTATTKTLNSGSTVEYLGNGTGAATTHSITQFNAVHHLTINDASASNADTFQLGAALDVNGNFTLTDGTFSQAAQTLNIAGNVTITDGATFTKSTNNSALTLDGDLTLTDNSTTKQDLGNLVIGASPDTTDLASDIAATTLTIPTGDILNTNGYDVDIGTGGISIVGLLDATDDVETDTTIINNAGNWANTGTFTQSDSRVIFDGTTQTIADSTTFYDLYATEDGNNAADTTLTFTAGTTQTVQGVLSLQGTDTSDRINLRSTAASAWNIDVDTPGSADLDFLDVEYSNNTSGTNLLACQSISSGNNTAWNIYDTCALTGVAYSDEGTTPLTSHTVRVAIDGVDHATTAETDAVTGAWAISDLTAVNGDILTIYLEDETADAVTVTETDGTDISNFDLYQNRLITRHDNFDALTNADLATAAVTSETDISAIYAVSGGNVTVVTGKGLFVPSGHAFTPGGNVTIGTSGATSEMDVRGTFTKTTQTLTINGNYEQSNGIFNGGSGTIDINGTYTLSSGTFTATSGAWTNAGNLTISGGTFNHNSGSVTLDFFSARTVNVGSATFNNVTIAVSNGGAADSVTITGNWDINGNLTISYVEGFLGNGTILLAGNLVTTNTSVTVGSVLIKFDGAGDQSFNASGGTGTVQADIEINKSSGTLTLADTLQIQSSPVAPADSHNVWTLTAGTVDPGSSTVIFGYNSTGVINAASMSFYNLTANLSAGGNTETLAVTGTLDVNNNFTISSVENMTGGTVTVGGNFTSTDSNVGASSTLAITFDGTSSQTFTATSADVPNGDITINKASGIVTLASNADWNAASQDLTITSGTLNQGASYTLATGAITVGATGSWLNTGTGDITLGGNVTNNGWIHFNGGGGSCGTDEIVITSSAGGTQRTWTNNGQYRITDISATDQAGTITVYSSTSTSNNAWTFSGDTCVVERVWDHGGGDNTWATATNWSEDTAPTSSDIALFDATSLANANITANISVAGLLIAPPYSGTITQNSTRTVTVGASNYAQYAGTFTGGDSTIDMNGNFVLSGGTFTSTTGTMLIGGAGTSTAFDTSGGGTFTHNNGTVKFDASNGASKTIDVATSEDFYNLYILGTGERTYTIASGDTLVANNDFQLGSEQNGAQINLNTGSVDARGDITLIGNQSASSGGTATININGTGTQTLTGSSTDSQFLPNIIINKASGTLNLVDTFFVNGNWTYTAGTIDAGTSTVKFRASNGATITITGSHTLNNIEITGSGSFNHITVNTGDTLVVGGDFTQSEAKANGNFTVQGDVIIGTSADGGTANLTFTGTTDQTYTDSGGNEPDGDITINKSSGSVTLASNADWNATDQNLTITSGTFDQGASYNLTTSGDLTIGSSGAWTNTGTGDITLGGNVTNNGWIHFNGGGLDCDATDDIAITSSASPTQRTWTNNGQYRITDVSATDQAGTLTVYSSTSTSNNAWTFSADTCVAEKIWDHGGGDNTWATATNWSDDVAPTTTDLVIFDGTSTANANIAANISVAGLLIALPYSGTITQNSTITVTIGSSDYAQYGGTFTGGDSAITINGSYTLSGGTFTATSGTTQIGNENTNAITNYFTIGSGVTFTHNSGTVILTNGQGSCGPFTRIIDVDTSATFYNLQIGKSGTGNCTQEISSGDTLIVEGTFTRGSNVSPLNTGTIEARGNVVAETTSGVGDATVVFLVVGDQTITSSGGALPNITINKPSGTVSVSGNLTIGEFTLSSGTFTSTADTLTIGINRETAINEPFPYFSISGGTFNHNSGTVEFSNGQSSCGVRTRIIDVATTQEFYNLKMGAVGNPNCFIAVASGDTLIATGTLTYVERSVVSGGTIEAQGDVVVESTFDGGAATLTFGGTNNQTYTDNGGDEIDGDITINKSSGTITLASNADWNATDQDVTVTEGTLAVDGFTLATNTLTVDDGGILELDGDDTLTVTTKTLNPGSTVAYTGDGTGAATTHTITGFFSTYHHLTINDTSASNADTFQPGAALDVNGNFALQDGTFSQSTQTMNVAGNFTITDGATFTKSSNGSLLTFDGDLTLTDNSTTKQDLGDIAIGTSPDTTDLASDIVATSLTVNGGDILNTNGYDLDVTNDITIAATGTFDATDDVETDTTNISLGGSWSNAGTFTASDSTVTFDGTTAETITSNATAFYNLTFNGSGGSWDAGDATDVDAALTITTGTFDLSGQNLDLTGATFSNSDTLRLRGSETVTAFTNDTDSGTIIFEGDGDTAADTFTITSLTTDYWSLTLNATDGASDTFRTGANITVGGNWTNTAGTFDATTNSNTVTLDGTSQTITGDTTFYNLTKNESADDATDDSLTFGATNTFTITNTLTLNGRDADDRINVQSSSGGSAFTFDVTGDHQSVDFLEITDTESSTFDIVCLSCTDGGGTDALEATPHWIFRAAGNLVIRGVAYSDEGTTALGGKTVAIAVNGTDFASTETNATTGAFSIDGVTAVATDVVTIYLEGETENAVTVTLSDGADAEDLDLYQNRLITRCDNTCSLTNADLATAIVSGEDDITDAYSVASGNLTVNASYETFILASHTFVPGGNITVDDIDINGTLTLGTNDAVVSGTWDATGGTFSQDAASQTMFTGTGTESDTITSNSSSFGGDVILNDGLVGYWKLDESSGTSLSDSSGYGNTGTASGASGTNTSGPAAYNTSLSPLNFSNLYARDFDSTDDMITTGDIEIDDSSEITVSAWVHADSLGENNFGRIVTKNETDPFALLIASGGWQFIINGGAPLQGGGAPATGQWVHVAGTYSSGVSNGQKIYVNGINVASTTKTGALTANSNTVRIGNNEATSRSWDGQIDDVRIYNRALSPTEVSRLAAGNQPQTGNVTYTLEDALDVEGDLVLNAGTLDTNSGESNAIALAGGWENNGGIFTANSNTVTLNGSAGSHELQSGGSQFNNFTINGSGATHTLQDDLYVGETITHSAGTLNTHADDDWDIYAGNYSKSSGTLTTNASRLTLDHADAKTLTLSDTLYDLDIGDSIKYGLQGYWKLDEGTGTTAADSSGNGINGTLSNGPTWTTTTPSLNFTNPYALDFDGTNDRVLLTNAAAINPTGEMTAMAWINTDTVASGERTVVEAHGDSTYKFGINETAGKVQVGWGGSTPILTSTNSVNVSTWQHVTMVRTGSTGSWQAKIYINGKEDSSTSTSTNPGTAQTIRIGSQDSTRFFDGKIDDVRIYNRALSPAEISHLNLGGHKYSTSTTNTFNLASNLDVNNDLQFNSGTLSAGSFGINLAGDWNNVTGGTSHFTAGTSTIAFDGTDQAINGSNNFYIFSKIESANDSTDEVLTFEAAETQVITDTWTLTGRDDNDRINLRSSIDDTQWLVDPQATRNLTFLDVADSNNINATTIVACKGDIIEPENNNTNWEIDSGLIQNDWRWYVDNDDEDVTDPWPTGSRDLSENTLMSINPVANDPIQKADEVRARVNFTTSSCEFEPNTLALKLQYTQSNDCTDVGNTWTDVGAGGSGSIWRYATSSVANDTELTDAKLASTDVLENYIKTAASSGNVNAIAADQDAEWDFHIEHNGALDAATYCFRAIETDDTALNTYNSDGFPKLETRPGTGDVLRHGKSFIDGVEKGFLWAD